MKLNFFTNYRAVQSTALQGALRAQWVKVSSPFWKLVLAEKKKNTLLFTGLIVLNTLGACLEGFSFIFILASCAVLTGEAPVLHLPFSFEPPNPFVSFLCGAILFQILRSVACYCGTIMLSVLTVNIQAAAQKATFRTIFRMDYPNVSEMKRGDLLHHASSPPSFIPMLFDEYNRALVAILMATASLFIMIGLSLSLTLSVLAFFLLVAALQKFLIKRISQASQVHSNHIAELSKQTAQNLEGLKLIHILHRQERTIKKMDRILTMVALATKKLKRLNALIPSLNDSLGVLLVGVSLFLGTTILRQSGPPYISSLFVFLALTYRLAGRLQQLMASKGNIAYYSGPLHRMNDLLSQPQAMSQNTEIQTPLWKRSLTIENLTMLYDRQQHFVLKNVSFEIPKNNIVALVGMSGAGKSTLIDLLIRLYNPTQGTIKMDGIPIQTYSLPSWRSLFGVVSQDPFLFHDTIEANIRYGCPQATRPDIIAAAVQAGADLFIKQLPKGYHTIIGERGVRLSGGERQRISLAQALVRNPEIILLDEATSHLDSHSESLIQQTILNLRNQKTFLIVAHRLSTIQMADLIYVLEKGELIEAGTHQELLQKKGRYHYFWNLQQSLL